MYQEFKNFNLPEIDREILAFWEQENVFDRSVEQRDPKNSFVFYEGPPSANGKPGIHHVMARAIKDIFCRFHAMQGQRVERKGGWDTHGLPIELNVEKELGITKEDIGKTISVEEYNQKCRETVMRYKDMWDDITRKMGYWVDLDNPYITYENEYIETVWWLLRQLYDKDLLYKGFTIQPFSPAAGTGLSSHELNMPNAYQMIKDISAVAQFKIKGKDNEYFLAWTTTPWTLPSNTALAVGEKITYVKVRTFNRYTQEPIVVILAKDRMGAYFSEQNADLQPEDMKPGNKPIPYLEIVEEVKGKDLEGMEYEQLLPYVVPDKPAFKVLLGDFVSTEDGTGIVHIAPTFGSDDFRVAQKYGIPPLMVKDEADNPMPLVDRQGRFVKEVTDFAGRYVKDYGQEEERPVDADIAIKLKEENKLFVSEKYEHSYPHCWRTDRPVLYYPLDSWFVRASSMKERMYELNQTINWKPAATGEGRFGKWLENLQDWNLSRSRYWGIPLPIWRTKDGKQEHCVGSIADLQEQIEKANAKLGMEQEVPADLHRPYIDDIVLVSADGEPMYRELDLIDVWFDSGSMPYAQWHYPFENKEKFERNYPADFIAEGVDQTRGWFYTLHAIGTMVFDSVAFKNVVSNGLVLDKNGAKMSKRLGNAVDPFETLATYGADATRWYMISNSDPWDNLKFDSEGVADISRRYFRKVFELYSFFALYANLDSFDYSQDVIPAGKRPEIDRWIISMLHTLIRDVTEDYANYEPTAATRKIMNFVDEHLSNWYVRLNRRRFWKGDYSDDKRAAYQTLYECLLTVAKLSAPVAPFFTDWLYRNLNGVTGKEQHESVHLTDFPQADTSLIDVELEQRMDYAQRISSLVLSLRKKDSIRVRQPLQKILLPVLDADFQKRVDAVQDLILAEVNIKEIEYVTDTDGIVKKKAKPNFKTLGRRLGKDMKGAVQVISQLDQAAITQVEKTNSFQLEVNGTTYDLTLEDFDIVTEDIPGWQVASDGDITVALDVTITPELEAEGMARDLVNRIQNIRKDKDFEVTDRIHVRLQQHDAVASAIRQYGNYIQAETLAESLELTPEVKNGTEIELPGELNLLVSVEK
ncbi:isoleucine--tRNA ligase [Flavilitoribacter nigricans]|uniref:Isoleucine--tRNA ligase n=1 Tax=Flavilitoribacter nigricans (strain ATCC 23147 / DSM 23189 / NBRC 102662 / NCIMB 1420 / SS-2) TaxID=1122177 RepID=A0A2D0NFV5_FLAN2|nr:isoleucine--tRNA ligase [Flavilitoribacter nigricans]PHN07365.1 isoleucine--tRNA ligase [Flavilitoribacter nigricans DSM 23189 = NBRC 102662]